MKSIGVVLPPSYVLQSDRTHEFGKTGEGILRLR
jgi:hypothetical protein